MEEWSWKNFTKKEMSCKCCCRHILDEDFMNKLQNLRYKFGKPMIITSGYRCSRHNDAVSSTGLTGVHTTGKAADIRIHGKDAYDLLGLSVYDFSGIGICQTGDRSKRFIHLDTLEDTRIRPTLWSS